MRRLLLFRHAEAVHCDKYSDWERPLTAAGRDKASRVGAFLAETHQRIDLVLASDSVRTRETWEVAQAAYAGTPEVQFDRKLYHAERRDLMAMARDLPDSVESAIVVGHNPAIAEFAVHFAGSGERDALARLTRGFPPGGLAILDADIEQWRQLRWGAGELGLFLTLAKSA
ncbi:histidine phosphatase family protein [uncultured Rhodoblastus sp.]|uniref:SixA phosphatase family protein n=1 Tax=uncultured Rhodoblastus sp. TaxID=543037 RepID=UPI0025ECAE0E|nr:histidine phosphatase family protein [uncultured Rhodoblastus sp.]